MRFRRKPAVIDAIQWDGSNTYEVTEFLIGLGALPVADGLKITEFLSEIGGPWRMNTVRITGSRILIEARHAGMTWTVEPGDWIIHNDDDDGYRACKPDAFASAYEVVS